MITKELTIIGKQVTLAYCYGTEINFKLLSKRNAATLLLKSSKKSKKTKCLTYSGPSGLSWQP